MNTIVDDALQLDVFIEAKPETVFSYFIDADKMRQWMGSSHVLEAQPGGTYRVEVNANAIARGKFVEVTPHRRIVFTWGWEAGGLPDYPPGSTTVEIELAPERGGTRVTLTHRGLPPEGRRRHNEGWTHYLARLAIAGAGGDPGVDPVASRGSCE